MENTLVPDNENGDVLFEKTQMILENENASFKKTFKKPRKLKKIKKKIYIE